MYFDKRILTDDLADNEVAINYFAHSSVFLRHGKRLFVFDYANPASFPKKTFLGLCPIEAVEKFDVYILSSHVHGDHWSSTVLDLPKRDGLHYALSFDIPVGKTEHSFVSCTANKWHEIGDIRLFTPPSSDEGVAFLIEAPGLTIYHSGDNAFWDWQAERVASGYFKEWLQPVIDLNKNIDVAFQVADPRCHETHYGGIHDISTFLKIDLLVPIHNFNDFSHQEKMRDLVKEKHPRQNYWHITGNGKYLRHKYERETSSP